MIWPVRSLVSGKPSGGVLSVEDFIRLTFITGAMCQKCGTPQELDLGPDMLCAACIARPPVWASARAALIYDDISRIPILGLKWAGHRHGLKTMAGWMVGAGHDSLAQTDYIVPVPLHYRRLVRRGFNQAGWLAGAIARLSGRPVKQAGLIRKRATKSQSGLSARQRKRNLVRAFEVRPSHKTIFEGKTILLIDDVMTTGATLRAASQALKKGGAAQIHVLTLARVVRPQDMTI